ncbi:MAG: hypothetical protein IEMM0008_1718 [bacterium]|nr:MAG: hypothetical protein IEMM0008_1718 [bacterium]
MRNESFHSLNTGTLRGLQDEDQYIRFVESLSGDGIWYALDFLDDEIRVEKIDTPKLQETMRSMHAEVKSRKQSANYPHTYIHTPALPKMIKLYDPMKSGSSCSVTSPEAWRIFSIVEPAKEDLEGFRPPQNKGFFSRLLRK